MEERNNQSWVDQLNEDMAIRRIKRKEWEEENPTWRQKEAGKIGGKQNIESGHWDSLKTKEHQSKAGKIGGKVTKESGALQKACVLGGKQAAESGRLQAMAKEAGRKGGKVVGNRIHKCPYCPATGKSNIMLRWHYDNCKFKDPNYEPPKKPTHKNCSYCNTPIRIKGLFVHEKACSRKYSA